MNSRVVIPFANADTDPVALGAVQRSVPTAEPKECVGDYGYGRVFRELWLGGKSFVIVEHDVIPGIGMIEQLDACPQPWCAHAYGPSDHLPQDGAMWGLVKFRPSGPIPFDGDVHWGDLAAVVQTKLLASGWTVHQHYPPVMHLAHLPQPVVHIPGPRNQQV